MGQRLRLCLAAVITYLQRCEVDHIVDIWMLVKDLVQSDLMGKVDSMEFWSHASEKLDAADDLVRGVVEIVNDDDLVASLDERKDGEGTNVAAASARISMLSPSKRSGGLMARAEAARRRADGWLSPRTPGGLRRGDWRSGVLPSHQDSSSRHVEACKVED
jgi:hypothetical protein